MNIVLNNSSYLVILQRFSAMFCMAIGYGRLLQVTPSTFQLSKRWAVDDVTSPVFINQSSSPAPFPLPHNPLTFSESASDTLIKVAYLNIKYHIKLLVTQIFFFFCRIIDINKRLFIMQHVSSDLLSTVGAKLKPELPEIRGFEDEENKMSCINVFYPPIKLISGSL